MKILLHACCAPCAGFPLEKLKTEGFEVVLYFYNPNIYPENEYLRRFLELKKFANKKSIELIEEKYLPENFLKAVNGFENEPEKGQRCFECFKLRLLKTAKMAKSLNIQNFTTTLTVSPHKNSAQIFKAAKIAETLVGVNFLPFDFKKQDGFKITREIARKEEMYAQNYCGCKFSIRQ